METKSTMLDFINKIKDAENQLLCMVIDPTREYEQHIIRNNVGSTYTKLYDVELQEYICTIVTVIEDGIVTVKMLGPCINLNEETLF